MVFDDGQGLEGLPEAHAVGDDAAAEPGELVDGSDRAVALELEELFPHDCVADAGCGFDDLLLIQFVAEVLEQVVKREVVGEGGGFVRAQVIEEGHQRILRFRCSWQTGPEGLEPRTEHLGLRRTFGALNQAERVARREAQSGGGERAMAGDDLSLFVVRTFSDEDGLGDLGRGSSDFDRPFDPVGALLGQPMRLETIAGGAIRLRTQNALCCDVLEGGQRQTATAQSGQQVTNLRERKQRERRGRRRERGRRRQRAVEFINDAVIAGIVNQLHRNLVSHLAHGPAAHTLFGKFSSGTQASARD